MKNAKNMNTTNKGFTLIELLSVIVILAVIALIAIPTILNIIEDVKKAALKDSAYGIIESATLSYARTDEHSIKDFVLTDSGFITTSGEKLDYKGNVEGTGNVIVDINGDITICINSDGNYAYKSYSDQLISVGSGDTCKIEDNILVNKYVAYLESNGSTINGYYTKTEVDGLLTTINSTLSAISSNVTEIDTELESSTKSISSLLNTTNFTLGTVNLVTYGKTRKLTALVYAKTILTAGTYYNIFSNLSSADIPISLSYGTGNVNVSTSGMVILGLTNGTVQGLVLYNNIASGTAIWVEITWITT